MPAARAANFRNGCLQIFSEVERRKGHGCPVLERGFDEELVKGCDGIDVIACLHDGLLLVQRQCSNPSFVSF